MQDVVIVCAGGFGREAYALIRSINRAAVKENKEEPYNVLGFLSDDPYALDEINIDKKIIGTIQEWQPRDSEVYVLGISNPKAKEKLSNMLKDRGAKFISLVSPKVYVPDTTEIGEGSIISAYSVGENVKIGRFVNIAGSMIGGNAVIGDYCTTTGFTNITNAILGKRVFVGSHAVIMNKRKIGDDAFICVGSVVFNNVKPGTKVFGIPAKKVNW